MKNILVIILFCIGCADLVYIGLDAGDQSSSTVISSSSSSSDPALILWNTMGSVSEIQTSIVGPALISGSACAYVSGKFGMAISNTRYGPRTTRAKLPSGIIYFDNFSFEFWIKKNPNIINGLGAMISLNESGQVFHFQQREGYGGNYRISVELEINGVNVWYSIEHENIEGCNAFLPPGEWVHLGVSVNFSKSAGSRIKIFRNGTECPTTVINEGVLPHQLLNYSPFILANWAWDDDGFDGCMDNIKFYNAAKTNFIITGE